MTKLLYIGSLLYFCPVLTALLKIAVALPRGLLTGDKGLDVRIHSTSRRDIISISNDPDIFEAGDSSCEYSYTSTLRAGKEKGQLYAPEGLEMSSVLPGWVDDFALGAATVGLLTSELWSPLVWAWVDDDSGDTIVKVDLQGPGGIVILSDTLAMSTTEGPDCYGYFGYHAPDTTLDQRLPELYMPFVEKALAVVNGGYKALNGMSASDAFNAMTGQPGTVLIGTVGTSTEAILGAIEDAVTNNHPCVLQTLKLTDLPSFDEYDPDTGEVTLPIGTLAPVEGWKDTIGFTSSEGTWWFFTVAFTVLGSSDSTVSLYNVGL